MRTVDVCGQEEPFPLVEAKFRGQLGGWDGRGEEQREAQGSQGRDLEKPVPQQPMGERGGLSREGFLGLRVQADVFPPHSAFASPFGHVARRAQ